jgi:hypothetical protein
MKKRFATEWLVFLACCLAGIPIKPLIDPPMNFSGVMLGPFLYLAIGVLRVTVAAIRTLSARRFGGDVLTLTQRPR